MVHGKYKMEVIRDELWHKCLGDTLKLYRITEPKWQMLPTGRRHLENEEEIWGGTESEELEGDSAYHYFTRWSTCSGKEPYLCGVNYVGVEV